ncbi:hypothetical protein HHI36_022535 [Cryptolaemus montrouzieri]|uniref:Uncharacterized protein n=1 Tax=Cryptolaemus montrouzieri TaxID=559131 RepID=A0ABD2MZX9_9CUCU
MKVSDDRLDEEVSKKVRKIKEMTKAIQDLTSKQERGKINFTMSSMAEVYKSIREIMEDTMDLANKFYEMNGLLKVERERTKWMSASIEKGEVRKRRPEESNGKEREQVNEREREKESRSSWNVSECRNEEEGNRKGDSDHERSEGSERSEESEHTGRETEGEWGEVRKKMRKRKTYADMAGKRERRIKYERREKGG